MLFRQPGPEDRGDIRPQGGTPHLPPFSEAADVSTDPELYILAPQRGDLAVPQAGLNRQQQERAIPPADPRPSVRSGHQCGRFFLGEELHRSSLEALGRNCENALALQAERRFSESDVPEEGMERRETMVSRARPVASIKLQVFEESLQERGIEFIETQSVSVANCSKRRNVSR